MKTSAVLCVLLFVVIATNANAQQPFYTDDAGVTDVGDLHLELNNEFDILQHSAYPNLRQDTTVYRFFYGLVPRLEVSIDSPLIGIFNATGAAYGRPFGPGDTNFAAKYNFREERQGSAVPALTLSMNVEVPTGDAKRQLGSGLVDYWLYGVAQKAISDRTVIHANGGILFAGNTSTGVLGIQTRGTAFTAGLSVVRAFQPRLKLGAEIYAAVSPNLALRRGQLQMLMGGNYEIRKDTTFDFGLIGGKFPASPRVGVQFGFTTTWHSNRSVPRKVMAFTRVDRRE
jgi:hypothetical protein